MIKPAAAAALLGVPVREVRDVANSPAGDVITTTDGVAYLIADTPDAEGKTGLMLLAAPSAASLVAGDPEQGTTTAWNGFPVFVSDALDVEVVDEPGPSDVADDGLDALTLDELTALAADLDVKASGRSNQAKHESLVAGIRAKRAEAAQADPAAAALAVLVVELDELTDDELLERAGELGVDIVSDRDEMVAAVARAVIAADGGV